MDSWRFGEFLDPIRANRWSIVIRKVKDEEFSAQRCLDHEDSPIAIDAQSLDSCNCARFFHQSPQTEFHNLLQMMDSQ
jgi:hypothetical protein